MATFGLDGNQIEDNTRVIEELKVSIQALTATIEDFFSRNASSDEEKEKIKKDFSSIFVNYLITFRGVDINTNLNIGKVLLTKYSKEPKARRWEINEGTNSERKDTNTSRA